MCRDEEKEVGKELAAAIDAEDLGDAAGEGDD